MNIDSLLSKMTRGHFAVRSSDVDIASMLVKGVATIDGRLIEVANIRQVDSCSSLARRDLLALHSLRWLDPLRRMRSSLDPSGDLWTSFVLAWFATEQARDENSIAWNRIVLEQRATVLALGWPDGNVPTELLTTHLEALRSIRPKMRSASDSLRIARLCAALSLRVRLPEAELQADAIESATDSFSSDGYAVSADLSVLPVIAADWVEFLSDVGVPRNHAVYRQIGSAGFWRHALTPTGDLVPVGSCSPSGALRSDDPQIRYVITAGNEGVPPDELSRIDARGLVSIRSGWGETERDVNAETLASLMLGPVRGRESHRDIGRVTYHSQGRAWLIDPMDDGAAGSESHSIVSVESAVYRENGEGELVRHYSDDSLEGAVALMTVFRGVQWQRHLVFVRTGNYVIIEDTVRSSNEYDGHLQWIVAPEVEIEVASGGFFLHADGATVALVITAPLLKESIIDDMLDSEGSCLGKRIRVPFVGASHRLTTIISDVYDRDSFRARRIPRRGKEFTVDISDKYLNETLVVTPELSSVVSAGLDPEVAVERTVSLAAAGGISSSEELVQRLEVRRLIDDIKSDIRGTGAGVAARRAGIERLIAAGADLNVNGLRDHGFGAALVDIAGGDLAGLVSDHPQVRGLRRDALVRFGNEPLVLASYGVPVFTSMSPSEVPQEVSGPHVWSVDLGQLVPSAYLHDDVGDVLTVYFHGATDRSRFGLPRYERLRSLPSLGLGPIMFFSDPTLDLDSRMILSWFVGTEEIDLHQNIARMIHSYAMSKGIDKVMLVGNSGGGFASLQVAAYLDGARVVSFNPQIQIDSYAPRIALAAHWASFGRETVMDDVVHAPRMDLIERYRSIGFEQPALLVQNTGDDHHYRDHFMKFVEASRDVSVSSPLRTLTPYMGPGHRVPPPSEYVDIVRGECDRLLSEDSAWSLLGMRNTFHS